MVKQIRKGNCNFRESLVMVWQHLSGAQVDYKTLVTLLKTTYKVLQVFLTIILDSSSFDAAPLKREQLNINTSFSNWQTQVPLHRTWTKTSLYWLTQRVKRMVRPAVKNQAILSDLRVTQFGYPSSKDWWLTMGVHWTNLSLRQSYPRYDGCNKIIPFIRNSRKNINLWSNPPSTHLRQGKEVQT